jgi:hypothetical protein
MKEQATAISNAGSSLRSEWKYKKAKQEKEQRRKPRVVERV